MQGASFTYVGGVKWKEKSQSWKYALDQPRGKDGEKEEARNLMFTISTMVNGGEEVKLEITLFDCLIPQGMYVFFLNVLLLTV